MGKNRGKGFQMKGTTRVNNGSKGRMAGKRILEWLEHRLCVGGRGEAVMRSEIHWPEKKGLLLVRFGEFGL